MKQFSSLVYPLFLAGTLAGCVTINIYFPAAAAEKVADKIIDEVWQMPADGKTVRIVPAAPAARPEKEQK